LSRQEGGKIFGAGSRSPIAISILVKNPKATENGKIYLHDIGDYLSREEKLEKITAFGSINGITAANGWLPITPDQHNDWVGQRDDTFSVFMSLGDKSEKAAKTIFENYSLGLGSNRDAWCYNSSKTFLLKAMQSFIDFYNKEVERYRNSCVGLNKNDYPDSASFVSNDDSKISWSSSLISCHSRMKRGEFLQHALTPSLYRPFQKQWLYFDEMFNHRVGQLPYIFPDRTVDNLVISVTGRGSTKEFCAFITNTLPDLEMVSKGQCFPLKLYKPLEVDAGRVFQGDGSTPQEEMFADDPVKGLVDKGATVNGKYAARDGITDAGFQHFKDAYKGEAISKEDLFYYIYGLLHSEDYKKRYADNLSKELPRIPAVKKFADFQAFSTAGRELAELHINYETVAPYQVDIVGGALLLADFTDADYRVTQMKFASKADKTRVVYNHKITMSGIPLEAYEYVVNGKPALEWVMERQAVTTHKDSGIVNDANLWATETVGDASYPLKLFQRVITVSLETMKLVRALPRLDIAVAVKA
jgi:predicted helicase